MALPPPSLAVKLAKFLREDVCTVKALELSERLSTHQREIEDANLNYEIYCLELTYEDWKRRNAYNKTEDDNFQVMLIKLYKQRHRQRGHSVNLHRRAKRLIKSHHKSRAAAAAKHPRAIRPRPRTPPTATPPPPPPAVALVQVQPKIFKPYLL